VYEFEIELRPLIGEYNDRRLGRREVGHPIWLLMYHDAEVERAQRSYWLQIGFVGWHTDSIEYLPQALGLGEATLDAIRKRVEEMTGTKRQQHLPPRPVGTPGRKTVKELDE